MNNVYTQTKLAGIFEDPEGPEIHNLQSNDNSLAIDLYIPDDLKWFEGHFPQQKVLPGVVQVDWACKIAKAVFEDVATVRQVNNIKFKTVVMPETQMQLELIQDAAKHSVKFHFSNSADSFSLGVIKYLPQ